MAVECVVKGAVDCRRRSLGTVSAVRPSWRKWSVIMCPGEGRGPPRPLQLAEPYAVCGCTCGSAHRPRQQQREQEARFRDPHRRAALLRTFSVHDAPPERAAVLPPTPPPAVPPSWTPGPLPRPVPPLRRHLTHTGAFGPPAIAETPSRTPSRPSPSSSEPHAHDSWMPTTRRLLLEPAPHRLTTHGPQALHGLLYGGSTLRTPPPTPPPTPSSSAFRPPSYYCSGEIVYELRPGPVPGVSFSVPVFGSMVVRSPQEAGYPLAESAPLGPKQCLRVLRPDELEQRKPTPAAPAPPTPPTPPHATPVVDDDAGKGAENDAEDGVEDKASSPEAPPQEPTAEVDNKTSKRQWLLRVVRENFNEQIGTLVERFVRRPRHDKSVRRVPGIGRKVNVNLQDFWRRSSGQERHMKTKDLLTVYTDSGMDWRAFQRWLTKDLQFMPSCAKLTALSLDIYQRYWSANWADDGDVSVSHPS